MRVHCPKVSPVLSSVQQDVETPEQRQQSLAGSIKGVYEGAKATGLVQSSPAEGGRVRRIWMLSCI